MNYSTTGKSRQIAKAILKNKKALSEQILKFQQRKVCDKELHIETDFTGTPIKITLK